MTTNKLGIKIYEPSEKGVTTMRKASFRNTGPDRYVRLRDYEELEAENERLRKGLERIAAWPDGGKQYGQANIKIFAAEVLSAYRQGGGE